MDGYRTNNQRGRLVNTTTRPAAGLRLGGLRRMLVALVSAKALSFLRYALAVLSFVLMLGVVAAMEAETVSLGAGTVICLAIGAFYLVAGHNWRGEEEN